MSAGRNIQGAPMESLGGRVVCCLSRPRLGLGGSDSRAAEVLPLVDSAWIRFLRGLNVHPHPCTVRHCPRVSARTPRIRRPGGRLFPRFPKFSPAEAAAAYHWSTSHACAPIVSTVIRISPSPVFRQGNTDLVPSTATCRGTEQILPSLFTHAADLGPDECTSAIFTVDILLLSIVIADQYSAAQLSIGHAVPVNEQGRWARQM